MTSSADILRKAGESFTNKLRSEFDSKRLNDTGDARNSISFKSDDTKLEIEGLLRVIIMVTGRKPGSISKEGVERVEAWITRKLGYQADSTDWKRARYFILKKIREKGTDIFTDRAKGLQIELLIDELNRDLFGEISTQAAFAVTETVIDAYK